MKAVLGSPVEITFAWNQEIKILLGFCSVKEKMIISVRHCFFRIALVKGFIFKG